MTSRLQLSVRSEAPSTETHVAAAPSNNNNDISKSLVVTTTTANNNKLPDNYLVKFGAIPSEAFYCTATTWRELVTKTQQVWGLEAPFFTFSATNAVDRAVTFRLSCAADFESVWANEDAPAMMRAAAQKKLGDEAEECRQSPFSLARSAARSSSSSGGATCSSFFGTKLIAHDHRVSKHVAHSSELYSYGIRPLVSTGLLSFWPARYCMRNTATDEVIVVCERESPSWGYAIQKSQKEWGVLRPLFRYVDDIDDSGERTVISVVTAEDFQGWYKRRRPLWPELLVFEHAAPNLLQEHRSHLQQLQIASHLSLGIAPLEADVGGQVGYFPSATNPSYQQQSGILPVVSADGTGGDSRRMSKTGMSENAQQLLNSFRPESLMAGSTTDREKIEADRADRRLQLAREKHLFELERALTGQSSPRRGNL